jgi:hypothetical protein
VLVGPPELLAAAWLGAVAPGLTAKLQQRAGASKVSASLAKGQSDRR